MNISSEFTLLNLHNNPFSIPVDKNSKIIKIRGDIVKIINMMSFYSITPEVQALVFDYASFIENFLCYLNDDMEDLFKHESIQRVMQHMQVLRCSGESKNFVRIISKLPNLSIIFLDGMLPPTNFDNIFNYSFYEPDNTELSFFLKNPEKVTTLAVTISKKLTSKIFPIINTLSNLTELTLQSFSGSGTITLSLQKLRTVDFSCSSAISEIIFSQQTISHLTSLDVDGCCHLTNNVVEMVTEKALLLKKFSFCNCIQWTSNALLKIGNLIHLTELNCSNTQLSDDGLQYIARSILSLKILNISFCKKLTSNGLHIIEKINCLCVLNISGNNFSDASWINKLYNIELLNSTNIENIIEITINPVMEKYHCLRGVTLYNSCSLKIITIFDLPSLEFFDLSNCKKLTTAIFINLPKLLEINMINCYQINDIYIKNLSPDVHVALNKIGKITLILDNVNNEIESLKVEGENKLVLKKYKNITFYG